MEDVISTEWIKTVKETSIENEYLVNGTEIVPIGNSKGKAIKLWIAEGNTPEPEFTEEELQRQELQQQITEAQQYLNKTDHKFYNGYKPKEGEDLVEIERLRDEAREFLRANEGDE